MDLCKTDRSYNSMLCGIITIKEDDAKAKLQKDIYKTAVCLPKDIAMEKELELLTKAAREMYELQFPGRKTSGINMAYQEILYVLCKNGGNNEFR